MRIIPHIFLKSSEIKFNVHEMTPSNSKCTKMTKVKIKGEKRNEKGWFLVKMWLVLVVFEWFEFFC
jgi:hypothetical protein